MVKKLLVSMSIVSVMALQIGAMESKHPEKKAQEQIDDEELQKAIELSKQTPSHESKGIIDFCPVGIRYQDLIRIANTNDNGTVSWLGKTWTVRGGGSSEKTKDLGYRLLNPQIDFGQGIIASMPIYILRPTLDANQSYVGIRFKYGVPDTEYIHCSYEMLKQHDVEHVSRRDLIGGTLHLETELGKIPK